MHWIGVYGSVLVAFLSTSVCGAQTLPGLEPFIDGVAAAQLRQAPIPGLVVVVVDAGRVVLAKGYGYADRERLTPVDPDDTLFRIGSISKLFVGTAIMQLAEAGKIDLDADVDHYLEKPLPRRFPAPIRIRDLLTHSAGFEEGLFGVYAQPGRPLPRLQDVIDRSLPVQAFPPATFPAYSNHGFVVLGQVIERVSGERYEDYVERHVMAPLGMRHSSAHQPLPAELAAHAAIGYGDRRGQPLPEPFEMVSASPGGGISASGADMGRFMLFSLGDAQSPDTLSRAALDTMQSAQFRVDPRLPGMGFVYLLQSLNGRPAWFHTGGLGFAYSRLTALPEEHFAIFVAYNSDQIGSAMNDLVDAVIDRYFPGPPDAWPDVAPSEDKLARYNGAYQTSGSVFETAPALSSASDQYFVDAVGDGVLRLRNGTDETLWRWIASDRFRQITGTTHGKSGDLLFTFGSTAVVPVCFERMNHGTRVNIRQQGLRDYRVALFFIKAGAVFGSILLLTSICGAVVAAKRTVALSAFGWALLSVGYGVLGLFAWRYPLAFGVLEPMALSVPDAMRLLFAAPSIAFSLAVAGIGIVCFADEARRFGGTSAALGCHFLYWTIAAIFLSAWHLLFVWR